MSRAVVHQLNISRAHEFAKPECDSEQTANCIGISYQPPTGAEPKPTTASNAAPCYLKSSVAGATIRPGYGTAKVMGAYRMAAVTSSTVSLHESSVEDSAKSDSCLQLRRQQHLHPHPLRHFEPPERHFPHPVQLIRTRLLLTRMASPI